MTVEHVRKWCHAFAKGRISALDEKRMGWPSISASHVDGVNAAVKANGHVRLMQLLKQFDFSAFHLFSKHIVKDVFLCTTTSKKQSQIGCISRKCHSTTKASIPCSTGAINALTNMVTMLKNKVTMHLHICCSFFPPHLLLTYKKKKEPYFLIYVRTCSLWFNVSWHIGGCIVSVSSKSLVWLWTLL